MEGKYGYCDDCRNHGFCDKCYRGSYYEKVQSKDEED